MSFNLNEMQQTEQARNEAINSGQKIDSETLQSNKKHEGNPDQWSYKLKNDSAEARLRLLPSNTNGMTAVEQSPEVRFHQMKKEVVIDGKREFIRYNEDCDTANKGKCPVCNLRNYLYENKGLYQSFIDNHKELNIKYRHITLIKILEDKNNPKYNGKIMFWEMPIEVWKKVLTQEKKNENLFSINDSKVLELCVEWGGSYPKYSETHFSNDLEPFAKTSDEQTHIVNEINRLNIQGYISATKYKSTFDEQKAKFNEFYAEELQQLKSIRDQNQ